MGIFHILQDKINKTPQVKLAVVGTTGSGKTYLLTDLVGALEKLGYSRDDSFDAVSFYEKYKEHISMSTFQKSDLWDKIVEQRRKELMAEIMS